MGVVAGYATGGCPQLKKEKGRRRQTRLDVPVLYTRRPSTGVRVTTSPSTQSGPRKANVSEFLLIVHCYTVCGE